MAAAERNAVMRTARPDGLNLKDLKEKGGELDEKRPLMSPPITAVALPSVNPEPAYIAGTAASTIVAGELDQTLGMPSYDEYGHPLEEATVSPNSLALINSFLDRVLFNFLLCARSTTLASLRPAIVETLKPRLAKAAIAGADEELQEYLGGDDEELNAFHGGQDTPRDWDLDLVWRRARLRCMVYTRLGDMEEEDEEMYIEQEHLDDYDSDERVGREMGMVSPAVAIFLTSVLEFVGEHALIIATHAAYKRVKMRSRAEAQLRNEPVPEHPRVQLQESDVEKIALNANLGRLWRGWRKMIRSPRDSGSSFRGYRGSGSRKSSVTASDMQGTVPSVAEVLEPDPTSIALPMSEFDINEIEVPGYSADLAVKNQQARYIRPASLLVTKDWLRPERLRPVEEEVSTGEEEHGVDEGDEQPRSPPAPRVRSNSLPADKSAPMDVPSDVDSEAYETPDEELTQEEVEKRQRQAEVANDQTLAQKPISEPISPAGGATGYVGSVLNQLSRHVARELQKSPPGEVDDDLDHEDDPSAGELNFRGNDYIINEHERAAIDSQQYGKGVPAIQYHRPDGDPRISGSSSNYAEVPKPDVSPMGQQPVQSGEVSPIESSDDEHLDAQEAALQEPVSPLIEQEEPTQLTPTVTGPLMSPVALPSPTTPTARQRRPEESVTKDGNREAFVVAAPLRSHPSNMPPSRDGPGRRDRPVQSDAPNLQPLRDMVGQAPETSDDTASEAEPQHISRRAVASGKPPPPAKPNVPRSQVPAQAAPGMEKAAVQRVSGEVRNSTQMNRNSGVPPPQNSRSQSIIEKGKNRITSGASGIRGSIQARTSGEEKTSEERYPRTSGGPQSGNRDFEDLIASEETIQYTLTPQNMRNIEERKSMIQSPTGSTMRSPVATRTPVRASADGPLSSNAPQAQAQPSPPRTREAPAPSATKRTVSGVPREARVPRSNVQDFADFIRSTGPENEDVPAQQAPPPQLNKSLPSVATRSSEVARSQGRFRTSKGGERLQARDAQVRRSQHDDLIALLKAGPPGDNPPASAPRRGVAQAPKFDQHSVASTNDSYVAKSVQSSTNSRTGLLESNNNAQRGPPKRVPVQEEDMPKIKRKQHRNKDPYAISDDEEEMRAPPAGGAGAAQGGPKEESLAEFLSSMTPPTESNAPAPLNLSASTIKAMQRKTSNAAAKAKLGGAGNIGSRISAAASAAAARADVGRSGRAEDGMGRVAAPRSNRPKMQFQARDERSGGGGGSSTRELASFLAQSGPPASMEPEPNYPPASGGEAGAGFSRMFSRRRGGGAQA